MGMHPELKADISLSLGRFGPYLKLQAEGDEKPTHCSIPANCSFLSLELEEAVRLFDQTLSRRRSRRAKAAAS